MIRAAWRTTVRFLGSAGFATALLAIVGAWSMIGSFIAQGASSLPPVRAWAAAHPLLEPLVAAVGLHRAYSSPFFLACVLGLALSTALCAWQRTKAAAGRAKRLSRAAATDKAALLSDHDLEIACAPSLDADTALAIASETLGTLGIRNKRRDDMLVAVSPTWSVWGSPIFHWALLALIAAVMVGNLARAEGLMGVAVGQTKPDAPESYGFIQTGPLHDWARVQRSIRVESLEPHYVSEGVDRGPTPTVTLLDGQGAVVTTQRVYPNHTLKSGSLTIYPSDFGLSASVSLVGTSGVSGGGATMLVDFSKVATIGTVPIESLSLADRAGRPLYRIYLTVPLDRKNGAFVFDIPARPTALITVTDPKGAPVLEHTLALGERFALPAGGDLHFDGIGYYARLSVVDDWSVPLLYVGLAIAMVGLTIAVVARQQIVLAAALETPDGVRVAMTIRLWRNAASSRSEIEAHLTRALNGTAQGRQT